MGNAQWKQANPEGFRAAKRRYKTGKRLRDRAAVLAAVGFTGSCQVCGVPTANPVIDHDHASECHPGYTAGTGGNRWCAWCARGALCNECNVALGMVAESPDILAALTAYLNGDRYSGPSLRTARTDTPTVVDPWEALPGL